MTERMTTRKFELELANNKHEQAYLKLPTYPAQGSAKVSRSFRLFDIIGKYEGPDIIFDFDTDDVLVGIDIMTDYLDEEE